MSLDLDENWPDEGSQDVMTTDVQVAPPAVEESSMEAPKAELRVADRCDGKFTGSKGLTTCQAQAMVAVKIRGTTLIFCGHDFAKHADALLLDGGVVIEDIRASLTERPQNINGV